MKPEAPAPTSPAATAGPARVSFEPAVVQIALSAPFNLNVQLDNANGVSAVMPLRVKWDPMLLRLNDVTAGNFLTRDGTRVTSVKDIRNDTGEATLSVTRAPGAPGVSGSGVAASLSFVAVGKGAGSVTVTELTVSTADAQPPVSLAGVAVTVQ